MFFMQKRNNQIRGRELPPARLESPACFKKTCCGTVGKEQGEMRDGKGDVKQEVCYQVLWVTQRHTLPPCTEPHTLNRSLLNRMGFSKPQNKADGKDPQCGVFAARGAGPGHGVMKLQVSVEHKWSQATHWAIRNSAVSPHPLSNRDLLPVGKVTLLGLEVMVTKGTVPTFIKFTVIK